jgi:hypothetical protein
MDYGDSYSGSNRYHLKIFISGMELVVIACFCRRLCGGPAFRGSDPKGIKEAAGPIDVVFNNGCDKIALVKT